MNQVAWFFVLAKTLQTPAALMSTKNLLIKLRFKGINNERKILIGERSLPARSDTIPSRWYSQH